MATMELDQTSRSTSIIAGTDGTFKTTVTSGLWIVDDHVYAPNHCLYRHLRGRRLSNNCALSNRGSSTTHAIHVRRKTLQAEHGDSRSRLFDSLLRRSP